MPNPSSTLFPSGAVSPGGPPPTFQVSPAAEFGSAAPEAFTVFAYDTIV